MPRKVLVRWQVLDFIEQFKVEHDGNSPTYAEIQAEFNWKSASTSWWHVQRLESEGLVSFDELHRVALPGGEYIPPVDRQKSRI
jgi:SOS-response transcriptional repressor LexA